MSRMVEIDEVELQRSQQARALLESFRGNPRAWKKILEAQKEVKPDDPAVKDLDKPTPEEERYLKLEKALEDERKARIEAESKREQDEKIKQLQAKRDSGLARLRQDGWTEEGMKGVEKIMEEKGILDPLDAAAIFEKTHPPQNPIMPINSGQWNFLEPPPEGNDHDFYKQLLETRGGSEQLVDQKARESLRDIRGLANRR